MRGLLKRNASRCRMLFGQGLHSSLVCYSSLHVMKLTSGFLRCFFPIPHANENLARGLALRFRPLPPFSLIERFICACRSSILDSAVCMEILGFLRTIEIMTFE